MTESIYLSLKYAHAAKTGQRSQGKISYRVLTDELHQNLFITIVGNEGGGWFSNEIVAVSKIEEVLSKLNTKNPNRESVSITFPTWMIDSIDRESARLGVVRQSLIKLWLAEKLPEQRVVV